MRTLRRRYAIAINPYDALAVLEQGTNNTTFHRLSGVIFNRSWMDTIITYRVLLLQVAYYVLRKLPISITGVALRVCANNVQMLTGIKEFTILLLRQRNYIK
jgi:hypothetical protein